MEALMILERICVVVGNARRRSFSLLWRDDSVLHSLASTSPNGFLSDNPSFNDQQGAHGFSQLERGYRTESSKLDEHAPITGL